MQPDLWYFAYGANMASAVLARRGVTPVSSEAGQLRGHRLRFSQQGFVVVEAAFANLEPDPGAETWGVLHRLTAADLQRLDAIEGAEYLHVDVDVVGAAAGLVSARAYLNPHPVPGLIPSRRYREVLCAGAREHGLPAPWIERLSAEPARYWPVVSDVVTLLVGRVERLRAAGLRPENARLRRQGRSGRVDR